MRLEGLSQVRREAREAEALIELAKAGCVIHYCGEMGCIREVHALPESWIGMRYEPIPAMADARGTDD